MSDIRINKDEFIDIVRGHPAVWDTKCTEYTDKGSRDEHWNEIAEAVFPDWEETPLELRDARTKELKAKWRHLRDSYSKSVKAERSGKNPRKRKYLYADALGFLSNSLRKEKPLSEVDDGDGGSLDGLENEEVYEVVVEETQPQLMETPTPIETQPQLIVTPTPIETLPQLTTTPRSRTSEETNRSRAGPKPTYHTGPSKRFDKEKNPEEEDADRQFLLSMLPDYRDLSRDEKLDFKMVTLNFFRDARKKHKRRSNYYT